MKKLTTDPKKYGNSFKEHLLEQYKLYVSGIEKISEHRIGANNFFLSLNTAIVALEGFLVGQKFLELKPAATLFGLVGVATSIAWWVLINSYRQLNTGKFQVLHELEKELPAALYTVEWQVLGEGEDKKKYFPFSHIEGFIPLIYLAVNALLVVWLLVAPANNNALPEYQQAPGTQTYQRYNVTNDKQRRGPSPSACIFREGQSPQRTYRRHY